MVSSSIGLAHYLRVAGGDLASIAAAFESGADAVVIDLAADPDLDDDGRVAVREAVALFLGGRRGTGPTTWVRVNDGDDGLDDIALIVPEAAAVLTGIFVGDVFDAIDLDAVGRELELAEAASDREERPVAVCALLSSASAVLDVREIAEHERVGCVALDERALAADLGIEWRAEKDLWREPLQPARSVLVLASAVGRCAQPISWLPALPVGADDHQQWLRSLGRAGFGGYVADPP